MKIITRFTKKTGFTILEVLMVLGIASLIITMVLLAVNSASKSSRDASRRKAATDLSTALEQWIQNNNGQLPVLGSDISLTAGNTLNTASTFCANNYLANNCGGKFVDPSSGTAYTFSANSFTTNAQTPTCAISASTPAQIEVNYTNSRNYSIAICLETGSTYKLNP